MKTKSQADPAPDQGQHTRALWKINSYHAHCVLNEWGEQICACNFPQETAEANAAFIVQACNAHDDLVAALQAMLSLAGNANSTCTKITLEQARQALQKASAR